MTSGTIISAIFDNSILLGLCGGVVDAPQQVPGLNRGWGVSV